MRRPLIEQLRRAWGAAGTVKRLETRVEEIERSPREGDVTINRYSSGGGGGGGAGVTDHGLLTGLGDADHDEISDADLDTYVRTEISADEDIIHFGRASASAAAEPMRITSAGLLIGNAADLIMYADAYSTMMITLDGLLGHISAGGTALNVNAVMTLSKIFDDPTLTTQGIISSSGINMTANNAQLARAIQAQINVQGAFTASGVLAALHSIINVVNGSTANDMRNLDMTAVVGAGGTLVDRYGVRIRDGSGSGAITNQYGLYIENMTKGGTIDRAIQSLGGLSTHLGAIRFGSNTAPTNVTDGDLTATRIIVPDRAIINSAIAQFDGPMVVQQQTLGLPVQYLTSVATNSDPEEVVYQMRAATTNATVTDLAVWIIPADTTMMIEARIQARRTGGTAGTAQDGAAYIIRGAFKNVGPGTATQIGATSNTFTAEDVAAYAVAFAVATNTVKVQVTGVLDTNIVWHLTARLYSVST